MEHAKMTEFIQSLSVYDTARVLWMILDDPGILEKAYGAAVKVAKDVDPDEIMDTVFDTLDMLDIDDMNGRAERTRYGYVEPWDAAWEMLEETLEPYIDEMRKSQKRALPAVAKAYCIGIVRGLLKYKNESASEILEWVVDAPGEFVDSVVKEWMEGNPSEEDIAEVTDIAEDAQP